MRNSNRKINLSRGVIIALCVLIASFLCGCGDFFAEKPTEMQSQRIREDLRVVRPVSDVNVYEPEAYKIPPKIVEQTVVGQSEWKLFYFCRHHIADKIKEIVEGQFVTKTIDKKGQEIKIPNYTISTNLATNQLIVSCPEKQDVEAVLELLEMIDVPPIQVKIDCLISEIYADKTLDWETTIEIGDLLGEDISAGGSAKLWGSDVLDLITESTPLPAFPGASLREVGRAKMGLKVGYYSTKHNFLAVVDLLESKGYLKVLMNPTLEVVNGQKARIESSEKVPLEKIYLHDREGFIETKTEYVDVIDALEIVPHVFADGFIGLETTALIGSKNIPEGVKQIRIVSKREIYNQENRIRQGESLVIGGIRKSEEHSVVRGVPGLKDIPLLGVLFSSKDFEERAIETMFILTPTISSGGIPNKEMVEELERKHQRVNNPKGIQETVLDPFALKAYEREHWSKLQELEAERYELTSEKERARRKVRETEAKAELAITEAEKAKQQASRAKQIAEEEKKKTEEAVTETQKAKAETEKLRTEVEKSKTAAEKAQAETEKLRTEVEKSKTAAEKAKAETEKLRTEVEKSKAAVEKAEEEAEKAKQEAQKAKANAEKTEQTKILVAKDKTEAEKAK